MKKIIILFAFLISISGNAQYGIDVPQSSVNVDYDLRDYVSLYININGELEVEDTKSTISDLRQALFTELFYSVKNKGLRLPISIIELNIDKDLEYKKLSPLLTKLREMDLLKVHFVCNSKKEEKIEGFKTTGFLYRLNSINNSRSITMDVRDSLLTEIKTMMKARGEDISRFKTKMMPPPPPEITAVQLENGQIDIPVKEIKITNEFFIIENNHFTSNELQLKIQEWNSSEPTAYILNPVENCKYKNFLTPLATNIQVLKALWEEESIKKFNTEYQHLDFNQKRTIRNKYPFIMVIK